MDYNFIPYVGEDTFWNHKFSNIELDFGFGTKVIIALCRLIQNKPSIITSQVFNWFHTFETLGF